MQQSLFTDVILPLATPLPFTYLVPQQLQNKIAVGHRIVVPLGKRKLYTGIVHSLHTNQPQYPSKEIIDVLDHQPIVSPTQLKFWEWLSNYYMCTIGDVMNAALPASLKIESESNIMLNPSFTEDWNTLSDQEFLILEALEVQHQINMLDAAKILELQNPMRVIQKLLDKNAVFLAEELKTQLKPKTHTYLKLIKDFTEKELVGILDELQKSPKQQQILLAFLDLKSTQQTDQILEKEVLQLADAAKTSLKSLIKKNVLTQEDQLSAPLKTKPAKQIELSKSQELTLRNIHAGFAENKPVLLHGVTSSGKTEIYICLIQEALKRHNRALYLVPEISLTTQLTNRLQLHFGNQVVVYHSRLSHRERLAVYKRLLTENEPLILLGARSALLLPLENLGIIVIDEEHDSSFKQQDPAPRYNARDAALFLAKLNNCPILLGSATPSAESYYNGLVNKFKTVQLTERFGGVKMPVIDVVDVRKETLWKSMHGHFSPQLLGAIEETLKNNKKVILFQNRRGYTPVVQCTSCGHTQECVQCDISLTYHKFSNLLKCHYCGFSTKPSPKCPQCGNHELKEVGFGTEKLEEELQTLLPESKIARLDLDSTRKKNAFENIITKFEKGDVDILIGTQMVTKGLDFTDVLLVGIVSADSLLYYPDFRAQERAYQLMEQVAGRAGRRNEQGKVLIQSFKPDHHIIKQVLAHSYEEMIKQQLAERKIFHYPPHTKLIHIDFRHKEMPTLDAASEYFASSLRKQFGDMILGPEYPPSKRLKGYYHKSILLKLEKTKSASRVKTHLLQLQHHMNQHPPFKSVRCVFNVDPY